MHSGLSLENICDLKSDWRKIVRVSEVKIIQCFETLWKSILKNYLFSKHRTQRKSVAFLCHKTRHQFMPWVCFLGPQIIFWESNVYTACLFSLSKYFLPNLWNFLLFSVYPCSHIHIIWDSIPGLRVQTRKIMFFFKFYIWISPRTGWMQWIICNPIAFFTRRNDCNHGQIRLSDLVVVSIF